MKGIPEILLGVEEIEDELHNGNIVAAKDAEIAIFWTTISQINLWFFLKSF